MNVFEKFKIKKGMGEETKYKNLTNEQKKEYFEERLTLGEPKDFTKIKINYQKAIMMLKNARDTEKEVNEAIKTGSEALIGRAKRNYIKSIKAFSNYWNKYIDVKIGE